MKKQKWIVWVAVLLMVTGLFSGCSGAKKEQDSAADCGITLSDEELEKFGSGTSTLLRREGENLYCVQYKGCGTTLNGNKLTTNYNGMAVQLSQQGGDTCYPMLDLHGAEEDVIKATGFSSTRARDLSAQSAYWWYRLDLDPKQGKAELVAMVHSDEKKEDQLISEAPGELPDLSVYSDAMLLGGAYYSPVKGDDGKLLPIDEWVHETSITAYEFTLANEIEMTYAPLVGGEYYVAYQLLDKQGEVYRTEMVPFQTEAKPREPASVPDHSVKWAKGERQVLLLEQNGLEVYLSIERGGLKYSIYSLKVKNGTDARVCVTADDPVVNGNVVTDDLNMVTVDPGKTVAGENSGFTFGVAAESPELKEIKSLQFRLNAYEDVTMKRVFEEQLILVDMTEAWPLNNGSVGYFEISTPGLGVQAQEQVLLDDGLVRVTLLKGGALGEYSTDLTMLFKLENLSATEQTVSIEGAEINGAQESMLPEQTLPANCMGYCVCYIDEYELSKHGITAIETLKLNIERRIPEDWRVASEWVTVQLDSVN